MVAAESGADEALTLTLSRRERGLLGLKTPQETDRMIR